MIMLLDGPAAGVVLELQQAPLYLRVVRDSNGAVDAFDQPLEKPAKSEEVFVYRKAKDSGVTLVHGFKNGAPWCGFLAVAEYRLHHNQPDASILRHPTAWPIWCEKEAASLQRQADEGSA